MTRKREKSTGLNRRSLMKKAATTAAVGTGAAGLAGGAAASPSVESLDHDPVRTEALVTAHGGELLSMLSADGLLESADASALHAGERVGFSEIAKKREGTALLRWDADDRPDEIVSVRRVDGGILSVTVEPATGKSYAFYEPDDEDTQYLYKPGAGAQDVSGQACDTTCTCGNPLCNASYSAECTTCCSGDCQTNYFCNC